MRRKALWFGFLALAMVIALPVMAQAAQITVNYTMGDTVYFVRDGNTGKSATAEFGAVLSNYPTTGSNFSAIGYCVDLDHTILNNTLYNVGDLQEYNTFSQKQKEAAWLIHKFAPGITGNASSLGTTIAALQAAIWTVFYDTGANRFSVTGGNFYLQSGIGSAYGALAQTMLNSLKLASSTGISIGSIKWSAHAKELYTKGEDRGQELMLAARVVPSTVPEPGSLILFGSALFGGGFLRRRRNRKKAQKS